MGYLNRFVEKFYEELAYRSLKFLVSSPNPEIRDGLSSIGLSFIARIDGDYVNFEPLTSQNKPNTKMRQFLDNIAMILLGSIPEKYNKGAKRSIERANRAIGAVSVNTNLSDLLDFNP